jgi:hypothetical protein
MNSLRITLLILTTLSLPATRLFAVTDAEAASGRALVKRYADSVVSIELVVSIRMTVGDRAMPPRESKVDVNGTVISQSGLTVSCLSTIDPRGAMEAMRLAQGAGGQKVEIGETEFKDVKLRLANGTEVPSVIVLKDPDLNLVFIAPLPTGTTPPRTFQYVALEKEATAAVLGNYFFVSRASKNLQRVPIVHMTTVTGIVEKPRRMFLVSEQAVGVPVFDASGVVLGVSTQYLDNGRPIALVVLEPSDVADLAKQAAAIKPEEKVEKPEKPAETPSGVVPPAGAAPAGNPPTAVPPPPKP